MDTAEYRVGLLITAAGLSTRMGGTAKKEYLPIEDRPMFIHTLIPFLTTLSLEEIVITVPPGDEGDVKKMLHTHLPESLSPLESASSKGAIRLQPGGETRRESVFLGLQAFTAAIDYVLIHDGARPRIQAETIKEVLRDCIVHNASIPVIPVTDALKRIDLDGFIEEHLSRSKTMGAQTPQAFAFPAILNAHRQAACDGSLYVDDSEIYSRYAGPVHTVPGDPDNIKITFPGDLQKLHKKQKLHEGLGK
ncbi:MAG: 2-C-methyl-D-erythritol 4-phosphate cytidylyltransferase [Sediminispirochaetaceae bacterium]